MLKNTPVPVIGGTAKEWRSLVLASLVLILVLVVGYMCIQLYQAHDSGNTDTLKESYEPACSAEWGSTRARCQGLTTGSMPAIDASDPNGKVCCGCVGVPLPPGLPTAAAR